MWPVAGAKGKRRGAHADDVGLNSRKHACRKVFVREAAGERCGGLFAALDVAECASKRAGMRLLRVFPALWFVVCSALGQTPPVSTAPSESSPARAVLFVGNSYIYCNNLPHLVAGMAQARNTPLTCRKLTRGGFTLENHLDPAKGTNALAAVTGGAFNIVVLQEQSQRPFLDAPKMRDAVRRFAEGAKSAHVRTVLMLTWARQNEPQNQKLINEAYCSAAEEFGLDVAPVGIAWQTALAAKPDLDLYYSDLSHPMVKGSYLSACVIYAVLTGQSAVGLPTSFRTIDRDGETVELLSVEKDAAAFLQGIADKTVAEFKAQLYAPAAARP